MTETFKVGIQCSSIGHRCGIYTYSQRVEEFLNKNGIETVMFAENLRKKDKCDIINIQYEPGIMPPQLLNKLIDKYTQPIVITVHHTGLIPSYYDKVDGIIFHNENQIPKGDNMPKPWDHIVIPHPALVYPEKGKDKMREKYNIPKDKKVIGTAGFIAGTGKHIPEMTEYILENLQDDEFLYNITSFWKGGDFGYSSIVDETVSKLKKENQFKMDTEFIPADILNEKMQCCDLLFTWNDSLGVGGTSGIAMDMIGAHRKVIVKDVPHYDTASKIENVLIGRKDQKEFASDVLKALRKEDLTKVANPEPYSWDVLIKDFIDYFEKWL